MRLHLLEHESEDYSGSNLRKWAGEKGWPVSMTNVHLNEACPDFKDYDWLGVMGGYQHAWEEDKHPWLKPEKKYLAEAIRQGKTVLGLCFGAQLLAEVLGGRVFAAEHKEIGWHQVALTPEGSESLLFQNIPREFPAFHWHSDHYTLPPGCRGLARSRATPYQAFILEGKPVLGLQFHPEYTREIIMTLTGRYGQDWQKDKYVQISAEVKSRTEQLPDNYWLMKALLDNMAGAFGS